MSWFNRGLIWAPHLPVEAPVTGRWRQVVEQFSVEDVVEILLASQSRRPRGAVRFGNHCCVELLASSFFQRARIT